MASLLCVHPHPDDESIACGGVLARSVDEGHRVTVVTCTGGEEGDNLADIDLHDVPMPEVRKRELAAALDALGVSEHHYLGYRDSGMAGMQANAHPDSFHRADVSEAAGRLARIIRESRPDVVVSDDERGSYGHPDHVKSYEVTQRALELAADPGWGDGDAWEVAKRYVHTIPRSRLLELHRRLLSEGLESPFGEEDVANEDELEFGVPDEQITTVVDVRSWLERKRAALRAHASQIGEDSFFLNLPDDLAREVFGHEFFVLRSTSVETQPPESDLFAELDSRAGTAGHAVT